MTNVKKSIYTAMCIALCYVLPLLFHWIPNAGSVFLPMHLPVFICGFICGWPYGLLCGVVGPVLSSILTGMPPIIILPVMMIELATYGVVSGTMIRFIHTKNTYIDIYLSLIIAMISGRVVSGILKAMIFLRGSYSLEAWVTGTIITSCPGTVIQLVFIPNIVFFLMKAKLVSMRFRGVEAQL